MNYHQYKRSMEKELSLLNKVIDDKIVLGQPYYRESLRHKILSRQLARLNSKNYFSGLFSALSLF
ncbi:MAG TPA: hypothetical protein VI752_02475 [Candidatus Paceibacterota bacterium]